MSEQVMIYGFGYISCLSFFLKHLLKEMKKHGRWISSSFCDSPFRRRERKTEAHFTFLFFKLCVMDVNLTCNLSAWGTCISNLNVWRYVFKLKIILGNMRYSCIFL